MTDPFMYLVLPLSLILLYVLFRNTRKIKGLKMSFGKMKRETLNFSATIESLQERLMEITTIPLRRLAEKEKREGVLIEFKHANKCWESYLPDVSILEMGKLCGAAIPTSCGGQGTCHTCFIEVLEGAENLGPPTPREQAFFEKLEERRTYRLSCQLRPSHGKIVVQVPLA